jgi:bacterioferritin
MVPTVRRAQPIEPVSASRIPEADQTPLAVTGPQRGPDVGTPSRPDGRKPCVRPGVVRVAERFTSGQEARMDIESFVSALNEDLQTEYQSIIQYVNHVATISGPEFLSVIDELKVHLQQELAHAQILAEQVSFLGGSPTTDVASVEAAHDNRGALLADLRLETQQLERYRERFAQANDLGLADVGEALRPLLEQTQEHVRDLQSALGE